MNGRTDAVQHKETAWKSEQSDKGEIMHSWGGRISSFHLEQSEASKQM